jgi:hypothetical protein
MTTCGPGHIVIEAHRRANLIRPKHRCATLIENRMNLLRIDDYVHQIILAVVIIAAIRLDQR